MSTTLIRAIEKALMEEHRRAVTYVARYHSGQDRARQAYRRLHSFWNGGALRDTLHKEILKDLAA